VSNIWHEYTLGNWQRKNH